MKLLATKFAAGAAVLTLAMGLLTTESRSAAQLADVREAVQKIADALAAGDQATAEKLAKELAKEDLGDVMNTMALRKANKKMAFGVGPKDAKISPDGIEAKLISLGKKPMEKQVAKESGPLTEMGYRVAAIAEVAKNKAPAKDEGQKKKADWIKWSEEMSKAGHEFSEAAKAKNAAGVKTAAAKLNRTCSDCHGVFRD